MRTVGRGLVCEHSAVFAVTLLCTTLASLRSAPIVLHCLYCCLFVYCSIINECIVREYMLYRRNRLTLICDRVLCYYQRRGRVVAYAVVEENGQGAVRAPAGQTRYCAGTVRGFAPPITPAWTRCCGITWSPRGMYIMNGFTPPPHWIRNLPWYALTATTFALAGYMGMGDRCGATQPRSSGHIAVAGLIIGSAHTHTLGPGGTVRGLRHSGQGTRNGHGRMTIWLLILIGSVA